ncbi:MAG: DNA-binding MurR/RpiR family transcriptional regulator, partial [Candidatus Azotimanducaceae bacterium]
MRAKINRTLDIIDAMLEPRSTPRGPALRLELKQNIEQVQDAYIELIQQALRLLMMDRMDECHALLHDQRKSLVSTFERISAVIEDVSDSDEAVIKTVVEFLFTRARLVDELKMFP